LTYAVQVNKVFENATAFVYGRGIVHLKHIICLLGISVNIVEHGQIT